MARPDRLIRSHLRTRYLVTLVHDGEGEGEAFAGVLFDVDDNHLVLVDATAVAVDVAPVPVDGQLWLPRDRIKYMTTAP